ncbi:MAG: UDP-galactopyranose mutase [Lachnospiraceae bacterium]|nr:UDP-galactopyranose mutase [Lachnospiraceae bacterium]
MIAGKSTIKEGSELKDFLIVGAGLYGAVMARELTRKGYSCIVIDKRKNAGGNIRTTVKNGIMLHEYGAHIFHTSDDEVWKYVTDLVAMIPFVHSPVACYKGQFYSLPFNMHTFKALFGCSDPGEAKRIIEAEACAEREKISLPSNLEEQALLTVGRTVYETLIKGYTAKQWGCDPRLLPADIIKRIPVRYTFDEDYFNDKYEGLPDIRSGGYTDLAERLLEGSEVLLETDYLKLRTGKDPATWYTDPGLGLAKKVIYTGAIDEFFEFRYGALSYRSLRFETEELEKDDFQGHAVVNYTDGETPYTRIIEHKHLTLGGSGKKEADGKPFTIITREYPKVFGEGDERYYPVKDKLSMERYNKYVGLAAQCPRIAFGGRLGSYRYLDMDKVIREALNDIKAC